MPAGDSTYITDGSFDWSQGVNSLKSPTIQSAANPEGLLRGELAWLENGSVRDGGITQRETWQPLGAIAGPSAALTAALLGTYLSQGYTMYSPTDGTKPYLIAVIGGHVVKVDVDFATPPIDLSSIYDLFFPDTQPQAFFVQAEKYLVMQIGDLKTNPLIWDGTTLTQSNGITGITAIGQPVPTTYQLTATNAFKVPAVGQTSPPINLTAPYPGNVGDNVLVTAYQGSTAANAGTFQVTTIGPLSVSLTTISSGAVGTIYTTPLPLQFQLTSTAFSPANVALGVGNWTVPPVNKTVAISTLTQYPGSVGDIITITAGATVAGNFKVTLVQKTKLTIKTVSSSVIGQTFTAATLQINVNSVRNFAFSQVTDSGFPWSIAPVGHQFVVYFSQGEASYPGFIWDVVGLKANGVDIGDFRVVGINAVAGSFRYNVTLETLSSTHIGDSLAGTTLTFTVIETVPNPFSIETGGGSFTIPQVGNSVMLGVFWDYPTGYTAPTGQNAIGYPGNVGDTIQIFTGPVVGGNPTGTNIGTFLVTQFDQFGNLTIQTVSSNEAGTVFSTTLIGSISITGTPTTTAPSGINQIPAAGPMAYYQGRIFYAINNTVYGGDIVGGPSGTSANGFVDSVLSVTESPLVLGGDGFKMPLNSGPITALFVSANLDAALGQGNLLVATATYVFSLQVPITRQQWISTNTANAPQINVVQIGNGVTGPDALTAVNGDIFYFDLEPSVRSLIWAVRYFQQWGNIPISSNEDRALKATNRNLLGFASMIYFNNRLLATGEPVQTPMGVVHNSILPLDFTPIATLTETLPPCWEGEYKGFQTFKLLTANFTGVQRAFAVCLSQNPATAGTIELWELTIGGQFENGTQRVKWRVEFPAFTGGEEFDLKKVQTLELWVDRIYGKVDFLLEYRPDGETCWQPWYAWSKCVQTGSETYPIQKLKEGFAETWTMPGIPETTELQTGRPSDTCYQLQPRLTITGFCRIRGLMLFFSECKRQLTYHIPESDATVSTNLLS